MQSKGPKPATKLYRKIYKPAKSVQVYDTIGVSRNMTIKEHEHTWLDITHEEEGRIHTEDGELFCAEESFCMDVSGCNAGLVSLSDGRKGIIDNADVNVTNWLRPSLPRDYRIDFGEVGVEI